MLVNQTKNSRKIHPTAIAVSQLLTAGAASTSPKVMLEKFTSMLGIPDVQTARGLKQCHQDFDAISSTLDEMFTQMRANPGCDDLHTFSTIVIYGRMAEDISLRTRIFNETHFLQNAVALLFSSNLKAGQAVIGALDLITRVPLNETVILDKLASFTSNVLRYAETHCPDGECMEDTMGIVTRCTVALLAGPDPGAAILALLPRVIRLSLDVVLLPTSTLLALRNMVISYSWMSGPLATHSLSCPDVTEFLVAGTRARDIRTRCLTQSTLLDMYRGKTRTAVRTPNDLSGY
ncbi:hypothetical protein FB45DRAFT_1023007 [Roridomyces roridus]|uniref:Uncharacterized protein n=1 Tax=Roridomyces roridus TaxID=1738132 RepID=A0AAD7C3F5_9AGAR|nr:hypothetical protein FB45DRAFT_1023007 [Roridomyces roridus]